MQLSRHNSTVALPTTALEDVSPLSALAKTIKTKARTSHFPDTNSNVVAYWLLGSAASVFGIVVLGGLTRLTESGLSITEWKPVTGSLPPLSLSDWTSEFSKYQSSPEFQQLNPNMTLDEFKKIYYMEWAHRLWGRVVGLSFLIPAGYFIIRRRVSRPMSFRLAGIASLIGLQGMLGWWMVKSGLKDDLFAPGSHPRVSQYRLAAHLGTAFLVYTSMLWNGLSILRENRILSSLSPASTRALLNSPSPILSPLRRSIFALTLLVFTTALSGALVAGLDAGLIYNDFPLMGLNLTPPRAELFNPFYSHLPDESDLWWRNMLENPATVQLDHRILATTTFASVLGLWSYVKWNRSVHNALSTTAKRGVHGVLGLVLMQVVLGISTLIYMVPVPMAALHQAGSLALLTGVVVLGGRVWVPRRTAALLRRRLAQGGMGKNRVEMLGLGNGSNKITGEVLRAIT